MQTVPEQAFMCLPSEYLAQETQAFQSTLQRSTGSYHWSLTGFHKTQDTKSSNANSVPVLYRVTLNCHNNPPK
jgi:hypothetical protein